MKLRNKTTGEIWDIGKVLTSEYPCWETLNQICEDWEDVEVINVTNTPLIKDEKVRKAVRAWAEANKIILKHRYNTKDVMFDRVEHRFKWGNVIIEFDEITGLEDLEDGKSYNITELCGYDEE